MPLATEINKAFFRFSSERQPAFPVFSVTGTVQQVMLLGDEVLMTRVWHGGPTARLRAVCTCADAARVRSLDQWYFEPLAIRSTDVALKSTSLESSLSLALHP